MAVAVRKLVERVCECGDVSMVRRYNRHRKCLKCANRERRRVGMEEHPNWGGGRKIDHKGYAHIKAPGHPNAKANGYVAEHRLVMAEHIGRPLRKEEQVHHLNGQRDDNRIENLELWSKSQPSGQRVEDLVAWAREILERYGEE